MTAVNKTVRPNIPQEWYKLNLLMLACNILYSVSFLVGFGYLSFYFATADISLVVKIPLVFLMVLLASNGIHLLGWLAHEGIHLSFVKNKYVSITLGLIFGSAALFPVIGYGITHWTHHRYTNQESDPDSKIYSKYKTFVERFFLSRIVANRGYFKNTFSLILKKPLPGTYRMPFSDSEIRILSFISVLFILLWLGFYIYLGTINFSYALFSFYLPFLSSTPFTGLRIYLEHSGTKEGIFNNSRTYKSPLYSFLLFGNNYHLEHHLYPKVPAYNLPKVHRYLEERGYFDDDSPAVVPGVLAPLKYLRASYQYPTPLSIDDEYDPFDKNRETT